MTSSIVPILAGSTLMACAINNVNLGHLPTTEMGESSSSDTGDPTEAEGTICGDGVVGPDELCDDGNADDADMCTSQCTPPPKTCKELLARDPSAGTGQYWLDLDSDSQTLPVRMFCDMTTDGGGWTVFFAASGADGEQPLVSDIEVVDGDPLAFQSYNINRGKKIQLSALSTETIFVRSSAWLRVDKPAFGPTLAMPDQLSAVPVWITSSDNVGADAYMGWANFNYGPGGDFGISQAPDGATCPGAPKTEMTMSGFDHHRIDCPMLNCDCDRQYLYSYSAAIADWDAGYDGEIGLGAWTPTPASCASTAGEGGFLYFYAAMR